MSLFDLWPKKEQQEHLERWLTPGKIVYLYCEFVRKEFKNKFLVVGAVEPRTRLLMINTSIPIMRSGQKNGSQTQVKLEAANYRGCLTHDSHVDCYETISAFTLEDLKAQLNNDGSRMRGELTATDRAHVVAAIKFAPDISPRDQKLLLECLK